MSKPDFWNGDNFKTSSAESLSQNAKRLKCWNMLLNVILMYTPGTFEYSVSPDEMAHNEPFQFAILFLFVD